MIILFSDSKQRRLDSRDSQLLVLLILHSARDNNLPKVSSFEYAFCAQITDRFSGLYDTLRTVISRFIMIEIYNSQNEFIFWDQISAPV